MIVHFSHYRISEANHIIIRREILVLRVFIFLRHSLLKLSCQKKKKEKGNAEGGCEK